MKNLGQVLLSNIPSAQYASGKNEILMKCPFCGDSPDPKHKHFYISLKEGQPHFYNCFKCSEKGVVTSKTLRMMSIFDMDATVELDLYNKSIMNTTASKVNYKTGVANIRNIISDNDLSRAKLSYINKRLGLNLTLDDLKNLKICPNLSDLLSCNRIDKLTRDIRVVEDLNKYFIGFISADNNFLTMRNLMPAGKVNKSIDRRYNIYNILGCVDNSSRFYIIPTNVDCNQKINIHIAEGPFDILSIYYNLPKSDVQNVYAAVCGKSYLSMIKYFLSEKGLFNSVFHVYIDNDINKYELRHLAQIILPLTSDVYIHQNVYPGEKDFGVKRDLINEQVYHIRDFLGGY